MPKLYHYLHIFLCFLMLFLLGEVRSQILFSRQTFIGGVTTCGSDNTGAIKRKCLIKWGEDYSLKRAYAITYRYGRPLPGKVKLNGSEIEWHKNNQAGPEQSEVIDTYFAPHAIEITDYIDINDSLLSIDFLPQQWPGEVGSPNEGYWGVYVVIFYEAPNVIEKICNEIYIADQNQVIHQNYTFQLPFQLYNTPVLFAIHSSRLSEFESDRSRVTINNQSIGEIYSGDSLIPIPPGAGVQGHFYYENGIAQGTNGDVANNTIALQDGIAVINEYLNQNEAQQTLGMGRVVYSPTGGANPHPSFNLTYTPTCDVPEVNDMQRHYEYCMTKSVIPGGGDAPEGVVLQAIPGYDHYAWTPGKNLSDSTIANPVCFTDTSGWYQVSMWNEDGNICPQTIPVFITVHSRNRPEDITITTTTCDIDTAKIVFGNVNAIHPVQYQVNDIIQLSPQFEGLGEGIYTLSITNENGCVWDSTVTIQSEQIEFADFTAIPDSGFAPLQVEFIDQSIMAENFLWLIDDTPFSELQNPSYTFTNPGTYQITLTAQRANKKCEDIAHMTIKVFQGFKLLVPNIITPNNDGMNDKLIIQTGGLKYLKWEIYNRWGNLIYNGETHDPEQEITIWSPNSHEHPSGVYSLIIQAQGKDGNAKQYVEQITVK